MDGQRLYDQISQLYPLMRSITGPGVRASLEQLQSIIPIEVCSVPSGKQVLDWEIPLEWQFREAYIAATNGTRLIDAAQSNLHVVNYSIGVNATMTLEELKPHLHTLPDDPDAIPYRTSYYSKEWGFCLSHNQLASLGPGPFNVVIDATHKAGSLNYGEYVIPGNSDTEVLVSTHICHPSLANDNLSGMVLTAVLAQYLGSRQNHLTWRFLFVPGTIGAITWLAENRPVVKNIKAGLVLTGLGDTSPFNWKESRDGNNWIDQLVKHVLSTDHPDHHGTIPFGPYGYDERQYCSPGFNLAVGRLTRGIHGTFPQYHTSNDNLDFVTPQGLEESFSLLKSIVDAAEADLVYDNLSPYGEPQLGKRGLYGALGAQQNPGEIQMSMLWLLNQSDGMTSILDIAQKSDVTLENLVAAAQLLVEHDLLTLKGHRINSWQSRISS